MTNKYINDMPDDSRAKKLGGDFHWGDEVTQKRIAKVRQLNEIAKARGQNMAQLAVSWVLRHEGNDICIGRCKSSRANQGYCQVAG